MRCLGATSLLLLLFAGCSNPVPRGYAIQEGDILFQSLPHGPLVDAIEGMSASPYSHCGLVERRGHSWYVVEAIGPVKETPLGRWIDRGRLGHVAAYRLRSDLAEQSPKIIARARRYLGRPYDIHYEFDDAKIYCSELVYKAVAQATGVRLGKTQRLGDLNWRPFGALIVSIEDPIPLDREMITPRALAEAPELTRVFESSP
jgi:hypothetical protein